MTNLNLYITEYVGTEKKSTTKWKIQSSKGKTDKKHCAIVKNLLDQVACLLFEIYKQIEMVFGYTHIFIEI